MRRARPAQVCRDRSALVALCAAIVVSPQLYGGVFPWSAAAIAVMCLAALALALTAHDGVSPRVMDPLVGVMVIAWLWTCAQAVPLPRWLAETLGLQSVQGADRLQSVVDYPIPLTISLDPGATQAQIVVGVAILAAFVSARLVELRRPGWVARAVVVAVALIGLSGLVHEIAGARAVFGSYEPRFTNSRLLAPIMNNNHLGGFLTMGALVAIGLAVDESARRHRALWLSLAAFCGLLVPWVLSRGAIGALVFGVGVWIWALGRQSVSRNLSAVPLALAAVVGAAIFFALEPIVRRFGEQDFGKIEMSLSGLRLLDGSVWWLGVGRGAFSSAFAAMEGSRVRITHPENILVQWSTEWGIPMAVLLVAVLVTFLWRRFHSIHTTAQLGLFVGLAALALQNLVDFSLEIPAIAVVAAAGLGALAAPSNEGGPLPRDAGRSTKRSLVALAAVLSVAVVLFAPRTVGGDTRALSETLARATETGDDRVFQKTLKEALRRHPSEPVFPLLAAAHGLRTGDPSAPRWLSIAMAEAPGWASPHLLAARWLRQIGRSEQALLEIREAERRTPGVSLELLCEILRGDSAIEVLEVAAPSTSDAAFYDRATRCSGLDEGFRSAIDEQVLSMDSTHPGAAARKANRLTQRGEVDAAIALLTEALVVHPEDARLWVRLVSAHLADRSPRSALEALDRAAAQGVDPEVLLVPRARVYAALGDGEGMQAALSRLRGLARGNSKQLAASYVLEGDLEASNENIERALDAYRTADRVDPTSPALSKAAALAERAGLRTQAYQAYRELCIRHPGGFACQRRDQLSRRLGAPPASE